MNETFDSSNFFKVEATNRRATGNGRSNKETKEALLLPLPIADPQVLVNISNAQGNHGEDSERLARESNILRYIKIFVSVFP